MSKFYIIINYLVQHKQVVEDDLMESRECQGAFTPPFPCNGTLFQLVVSRCSLLFFLITLTAEIYDDTHPLVYPLVYTYLKKSLRDT